MVRRGQSTAPAPRRAKRRLLRKPPRQRAPDFSPSRTRQTSGRGRGDCMASTPYTFFYPSPHHPSRACAAGAPISRMRLGPLWSLMVSDCRKPENTHLGKQTLWCEPSFELRQLNYRTLEQ
ncbi:hypothetical protein HJG60_009236 [Phyllostomus discolor]|uniref:Uncharacterized protein n=1 Tax=Phyllostomus discolor TaxID=89673 RepID=A0A833YMK6_9CHIR|nr:hypothetical protein HJG60_009236 [Phyllostomus discolor]